MRYWTERFPEIYAEERDYWLSKEFQELTSPRGEVSFQGFIVVRRSGRDSLETLCFEIRFDYSAGYPFRAPKVTFLNPKVEGGRHQSPDGHPCLFPSDAWDRDVRASELYAATEGWINYHLDGHFPRELAIYELPEYFRTATYSVLGPPEVIENFDGKNRGRFSTRELIGHDLLVLSSIDGVGVGRELVSDLAASHLWKKPEPAKWYRLDHEPPPIRHTAELQAVLSSAGHQVSFRTRPSVGRHLIGLVFVDEVLNEERALLLDIGVRDKREHPKVGEGWPARLAELHIVSRVELQRRLQGVRDVDALRAKKVAIFGLGSVGSPLAMALAREGVGGFELCDPDWLRPGNVVRHALDLTSVGQGKALAIETAIGRINPGTATDSQFQNLDDPAVIANCIADADLVVAAVGDEVLEELLCEVVLDRNDPPPLILVRTLHAGAAFRVALIRRGRDACFGCLGEYRAVGDSKWIDVPDADLPKVYETGCAAAATAGAGLTCQEAAIFAAARALEILEGRDREPNHWVSVLQPIEAAADVRLARPLALHEDIFKPLEGCIACAT